MVEKAKKKTRKILVTGSHGMLGVDLSKVLSRNYDVLGLDISKSDIQCDITDIDKTIKSIVDEKPDLVIHTAAWTDVDGCEKDPDKAKKINEGGTENIALAASKLDIPLIYISTDFVFDGEKKNPYTEEDTPNPLSVYGKTKLVAEQKVVALRKYVILRTGWLYGANGKNFVDTIIDNAKTRNELKVVDDQAGCPTYTKDFAEAIGRLLDRLNWESKTIQEVYHVSNKGAVSWFDYAREIVKLAKLENVKVLPIKSKDLARPAKRPAFSVLDNSKFEKVTNFKMRSWKETLKEYVGREKCRLKT
ncbi:MAG: dTDP-4-dehydrorhamnose reductase [Candidatus Omnitrophica bacterium]|nr:dTDP-4-dehydrorhamnose reductase [Candidatus Omnitrophota bacterium]